MTFDRNNRRSLRRRTHTALEMQVLERRDLFAADVVISEFQASNENTLLDLDGDSSDWIEIRNTGTDAVDLEGWYLTDDVSNLTKWKFPLTELDAGQFIVVFASGKDRSATEELHTSFSLSAEGEYLGLVEPDGQTIASEFGPEYPPQLRDHSFGRSAEGLIQVYPQPTPGVANSRNATLLGITAEPDFSVESGYHNEAFLLTLSVPSPTATIRYTVDSSIPSEHSAVYTEPIQITTTSVVRAASFEDGFLTEGDAVRSYFFLDDVLTQTGEGFPPTWGTFLHDFPLGPYRKGDAVPANYGMDPEVVNDVRYRETIKGDLQTLPTLSLVFDAEDLWAESTGIYSNPLESGQDWERPVTAELIGVDGSIEFRVDAGGRISGGFSRRPSASAKHSIRLLFKNEYGPKTLEYPWFGEEAADEFDTVMLRASYNFSWSRGERNNDQHAADGTFVQDRWAAELQSEMGGLAPQGTWVHLYLNGLYWGVYNPNERPDSSFLASYLGGSPEDYDVLKNKEIVDGDDIAWNALLELVRRRSVDYAAVQQVLDVSNFIDYMIINQFGGNEDWPNNNWYASRRREANAKWQFHSWDAEYLFRDENTNRVNVTSRVEGGPGEIFNRLRTVEEFRVKFGDHVQKHFFHDGLLTPEANVARLNRVVAPIDRAIVGESARWGDALFDNIDPPLTRDDHWLPRIEELREEYFPVRNEIVLQQYRDQDLYPLVSPPEFSQHGGLVEPGFVLTMDGSNQVYFTVDGSDPRLEGGAVNEAAIPYLEPVSLHSNTTIKARVFDGREWSALVKSKFVLDEPLPLQISEIMYHPADTEAGVDADELEFIELINTGGQPIEVAGASLANGIDFTFPSATLTAGERVVVVKNETRFRERYGEEPRVLGEFARNLGNREDTVELLDPRGEAIAVISYQDSEPWSTRADGNGASLEVVSLNSSLSFQEFSSPENWQASIHRHGTPGYRQAVSAVEIDSLYAVIRSSSQDSFFDLDESGSVDDADATMLIEDFLETRRGDANLDGRVDFSDFLILSANFGKNAKSWSDADFDGSGAIDFADFLLLSAHFGFDRK